MQIHSRAVIFSLLAFASIGSLASAEPCRAVKTIKQIVCQATATYEEETPNQKSPASGIKIFTAGSRSDVSRAPGNFLLSEYGIDAKGGLSENGNQQYTFCAADGVLKFEFIAAWKASGELQMITDSTASGLINQKGHVTELSCHVQR